jgi:PAS domain S-box-containing protein
MSNQRLLPFHILDTCPSAIIIASLEGVIIHVNDSAVEIFEFSKEEFIGRRIEDTIVPEEYKNAHKTGLARHRATGNSSIMGTPVKISAVTKSGKTLPIEITITRFSDGKDQFLVAYLRDLTEELAYSHRISELAQFPEQNPSPVMRFVGGQPVFRNQPATQLLATTNVAVHMDEMLSLMLKNKTPQISKELELDGRTYLIMFTQTKIENSVNAYFTDISAQKKVEESLVAVNNELEDRVKSRTIELQTALAAQERFVANTSHELRTPLNTILGITQSLIAKIYGDLDEVQIEKITALSAAGEHLLDIINDLLDLSKLNSTLSTLSRENVQIAQLIDQVVSFFPQEKTGEVRIEYDTSPIVTEATLDPLRMKQVLNNLISNALKFSPKAGLIQIKCYCDEPQENITFEVHDEGTGIPAEMLEKVFNPFVQVDETLARAHEGTGLGLALVRRLVEMHNGTVFARNGKARGCIFSVTIPWKRDDDSQPIKRKNTKFFTSSLKVPSIPDRYNILLVDDHEINRQVTADFLEHSGYTITQAENGQKALDCLANEEIHALILDVQMPVLDGLEVLRRIRTQDIHANLPVLMLTGFASEYDAERCFKAGANEFLSKPVRLKELREKVAALLVEAIQ